MSGAGSRPAPGDPADPEPPSADLLDRRLRSLIRDVADYPRPGVVFRDLTPLLADGSAFSAVVDALADSWSTPAGGPTKVVGIEARGFLLAAAVAYRLGVGVVPVRKAGKLPSAIHAASYELEYGAATLELHRDALAAGDRVLVVDDVLATGGTAAATVDLVERAGGRVVGVAVLVELTTLRGRTRLGAQVRSLVRY